MSNYKNPTPGKFPILAKSLCSVHKRPTTSCYKLLAECGFTMGTESYFATDVITRSLNNAEGTGVKFNIASSALRNNPQTCAEVVNQFKNNPNLGMWNFEDEPHVNDFAHLSKLAKVIHDNDPNHIVYINLSASPKQGENIKWKSYNEYLDIVEQYFSPSVWSYDLYPFKVENGIATFDNGFYPFLEIFSTRAKNTGRPFWAYCLSTRFKENKIEGIPTESHIRFEAFSALAYGAQGLVYWTYGLRETNDSTTYMEAALDLDDQPTKIWGYIKKINSEIHRYSNVFLGCTFIECRHIYGPAINSSGFGPANSVSIDGAGMLLSHLRNGNNDYLIMVSRDGDNSQKYKISFDSRYLVTEVSPSHLASGITGEMLLPAGGFMIYRWSRKWPN